MSLKFMRKITLLLIGIVIVLVMGVIIYSSISGIAFSPSNSEGSWEPISVTQENVADVMSKSSLVSDIPADGTIELYVGETPYVVQRGSMSAGVASNPDITLRLPLKYLDILGERGWCVAIAVAYGNKDLSVELHDGTTSLAWKYRELAKYKACLGN